MPPAIVLAENFSKDSASSYLYNKRLKLRKKHGENLGHCYCPSGQWYFFPFESPAEPVLLDKTVWIPFCPTYCTVDAVTYQLLHRIHKYCTFLSSLHATHEVSMKSKFYTSLIVYNMWIMLLVIHQLWGQLKFNHWWQSPFSLITADQRSIRSI